ncbi:MAG: 3'(2'),5'-bisphosphate nucleotidase CysQ [Xanthobacteraceae bacterium]
MPSLDAAACAALMEELTKLTARAAETILDLASGSDVRTKADGSPVTAADEAAEAVICAGLQRLVPALPIISEEQAARQKPTAIVRGSYFLVDPLDGTREFIAGRDEYTINIALMSDGAPLLGIICAPALHLTWRGIVGRGADRIAGGGTAPAQIHTRPRPSREVVIVVSRSHLDAHTRAYVDGFPRAKLVQSGSSIKFCRVAEGVADIYPRLAPTRDWDIAAGHAILKAAGGGVTAPDGSPLHYATPDLLIPDFIASGQPITG